MHRRHQGQVLAKVGFSLGAEGVRINACTEVVQLHLGTVADVNAGDADGGVQQQEGDQHHGSYDKEAGIDGDVALLAAEQFCCFPMLLLFWVAVVWF